MKKNISINISGIIFHIDEDGYDRLREYLDSINSYFSSFEDSSEIIADIESRIAEIFLAKLKEGNRQVVKSEDVEDLISTMGTVADFKEVEEESEQIKAEESSVAAESEQAESTQEGTTPRSGKLYRDMKRRILGGVASGIANYFGIDPLWIRLIIIILFFNIFLGAGLSGAVVIAYIIMWIVVPASYDLEDDKKVKKMYRDPEHKVLGGVASGLAAYFGTDITLIRLFFVLSIFLGGSGIVIYIILWIITPEAKSITEKMQMQGEPVTLSNIEHTVKDRLNVKDDQEESPWVKILLLPFRLIAAIFKGLSEILGPFMKFFVEALRVVIGIVFILIGLATIFGLVTGTALVFGVISGMDGWFTVHDLPFDLFYGVLPTLGIISLFVCAFVPALALGLLGFSIIVKNSVTNAYVGWTLFALWIIGLIGAGITLPGTLVEFRRSGEVAETRDFDLGESQAVLKLKEVGIDDYEGVRLTLRGHQDSVYTLITSFEARGSNRQNAQENAGMINYVVDQRDSVITFDSNVTFNEDATFRFQEVSMTLYVPYGAVFTMDRKLEQILRNTIHRYGYSVDDIPRNQWTFTPSGLKCVTCPESESSRRRDETFDRGNRDSEGEKMSFDFEDFDEIKASGNFNLLLSRGDRFEVEVIGDEEELDRVRLKQYGDRLEFEMPDWKRLSWDRQKSVKANVVLPRLNKLNLSGACIAQAEGFDGGQLDIDMRGASRADLNIEYRSLSVDMGGSTDLVLSGEVDRLEADISGSSALDALLLNADYGDIETSGVSSAKIFVLRDLTVDAHGASDVQYKGDPRVDINESRGSSVNRY